MRVNARIPTLVAMRTWLTRVATIPGLFALLTSGIFAVAAPAQAFSNSQVIDQESFVLHVDDVAICTRYKYDFSKSTTWEANGYQTCPSETITTTSLPATLHFKFRVQSKAADEFQVSKTDAYLLTSRGFRLPISKWKPEPLTKIDGAFNPLNQVFYGAIELVGESNFQAGTYTLYLELWNTMRNSEVVDLPTPYKVFTFTIGQGVKPVQVECTAPVAQFPKTLSSADENVKAINTKVLEVNQSAPGIAETLREYRKILQEQISRVNDTSKEAEATFESRPTCLDQHRSNVSTIVNIANNALSNVAAYLSKAEILEKMQTDPCMKDAEEAKKSIGNNAAVIIDISNELANDEAKGGGLIDLREVATLQKLERWRGQILDSAKNLQEWSEKLAITYKNNPTCTSYVDLMSESTSRTAQGASAIAKIIALISKGNALQGKKSKTAESEEILPESEGLEEEPQATLSIAYSNSQARFIIKVESNLPEESLTIRATKKGAKSLRFTVSTNEEGTGGLRTKTKLSGYTLVLSFDSIKLDTVRVR